MNREFMELYDRELGLFYEHAQEFADEYPGVAERLGSMTRDNPDPMIGALLEGAAFLATRVQLKLKHEFSNFTDNLLEQVVPNFLAPIPSLAMVQIDPEFGDPALRDGVRIERGAYLDATYRIRDRSIACRYRMTAPVHLSPLTLTKAEYIGAVAPLEALQVRVPREALAGLRLTFRVRSTRNLEAEPEVELAAADPKLWAKGVKLPELKMNLLGPEGDAIHLYEQIFGHTVQLALRWRTADLQWHTRTLPIEEVLEQIGFDEDEALYPIDHRVFRGFDYIRDYFTFPQAFLGFRLKDLGRYLRDVQAAEFDLVFVFDDINPRLTPIVDARRFGLFCAPAINLFEKSCDRIKLKPNDYEYQVVPDRSHYLDYEPHRIVSVSGHRPGESGRVPVYRIYSSPEDQTTAARALFYSIRRMQRRRTTTENENLQRDPSHARRSGATSEVGVDYMGTDMFLSLVGNDSLDDRGDGITELSVRALCSNRHLTSDLPTGETGADFILIDNDQLRVRAVTKPTNPREPLLSSVHDRTRQNFTGENTWRLVNMLALNHLGLVQNRAGEGARAIKDVLSLFADLTDPATERQIRALRDVAGRPATRRVRALSGVATARGLEVTITLEDRGFNGSAFLLGAILDRYLAEYVSINQFTQTVIRTPERNEIMRWPPRIGRRQVL